MYLNLLIVLLTFLLPISARAADFNPGTAAQLQQALNDAQANGQDDTITLPSGTFATSQNGDATFQYISAENKSLTLVGAGAGLTFLDGDMARKIMNLQNAGGTGANITVRGITFQNGDGNGTIAGGLLAASDDGNVTVEECEFLNNKNTGGSGGGLFANSTNGDIACNRNMIMGNSADVSIGGAQCASSSGNITFNGNIVDQNKALGGTFGGVFAGTTNGDVDCSDNEVTRNEADASIGGIQCNSSTGSITFVNNKLDQNKAFGGTFGGAFAGTSDGDVNCSDNEVTRNEADASVGGIQCNSTTGAITFVNNKVDQNMAFGGTFGGAFAGTSDGDVNCSDNQITNNKADASVGGIQCNSSTGSVIFINNVVSDNEAVTALFGGAYVTTGNAPIMVEQNSILGNMASSSVGGIQVANSMADVSFINNIVGHNNAGSLFAGVDLVTNGDAFVINNTVYNNSAVGNGGALHVDTSGGTGDIQLYNNIAYANTNGGDGADIFAANNPDAVFLFNNDFTEFCRGDPFSCNPADLGADQGANKDLDPMFVDAMADDFRLLINSPLIDMGTDTAPMLPAVDRVGNPRIYGPQPDMGALEAVPQLGVDPETFDFGAVGVGDEGSVVFTLTNLGTLPLDISDILLSDDVNFTLDLSGGPNPCGSLTFVLDFDDSCTLEVFFNPTSVNAFSAILTIQSNDPNNPSFAVDLAGTGIPGANGGCGCSMEETPPMVSHFWLWLLPMAGIILLRYRRLKA